MFRKGFLVFLSSCLLLLSVVDLLEDLDLPQQVGIENQENKSQPNGSPGFDLVRNILEFGDVARLFQFALWELPKFTSSHDRPGRRTKTSKIHKINRVFLI